MSSNFQRIGKYELQQRLGRGGMGEVWRAYDLQLHRYVAIKLLHADLQNDPEFITRFEREARLIASLSHPNIVQVHDFQFSRGTGSVNGSATIAYMVMDYIEGPTLANYIHSTSSAGRYPPPTDIVHLFTSMSLAIDYAHQQGMIHRDIKPANILLDKNNTSFNAMGEPILTDFGIAKLLGTSTGISSGLWHGTELYISPEQAQGYVGNELSDLYSLGIILYEMCTGKLPFRGGNPTEIMMQHIQSMPPAPALINPQISPALTSVILRSLAKDPAARFTSASSMAVALAEAFNVPVPQQLDLPTVPININSEPTHFKPLPSSPDLEIIKTSTPPPGLSIPLTFPSGSVPAISASGPIAMGSSASGLSTLWPTSTTQPPSEGGRELKDAPQAPFKAPTAPVPSTRPGRRRRLLVALLALLLLVLIGSGLGTFFLLSRSNTSQIIGHAYFVSSGHLSTSALVNGNSTQGTDDQLLIDLHNVPNSAPGKSYYAWLLSDKGQSMVRALFVGTLHVNHGTIHVLYPGDASHTNLVANYSQFLITEEDASSIPTQPSSKKSDWRYYAELPQASNSQDASMLNALRHLLTNDPTVQAGGLPGGLDIWLFRNTGKVLEFAGTARDYWGNANNLMLMRDHFIRILDYIDGKTSVQLDLPPNTIQVLDPTNYGVALLGFNPQSQASFAASYLGMVDTYVNSIAHAPGVTPEVIQQVGDIKAAVRNVRNLLGMVQKDVRRLESMTDKQLLLPSTQFLLDDMQTEAFYAFVGQLDPSTNKVRPDVTQIHYDIEQLATFNITPYSSS